jgi:hypothetical protein
LTKRPHWYRFIQTKKKWTKWGLVSAGGLVLTTAVIYYGDPSLIAAISSFGSAIGMLFRESGQGTALTPVGQRTDMANAGYDPTESQLPIVWDEFTQEQLRRQEFLALLDANFQKEERRKFLEALTTSVSNSFKFKTAIPENGLLAYYPFNGNPYDEKCKGYS